MKQDKKLIKIAIDISPLSDGNSIRGVGFYTDHLVKSLKSEILTNNKYSHFQIDLIENGQPKLEDFDLVHYPFFDPFKITLPKKKKIPTIVTVHDLIPRQFKTNFPVGFKGEIKWFIQKNRLRKVDSIITVSDYSKEIIKKILNFPEDRIFTTYEAADTVFKVIKDETLLKRVKTKYHLPDKFILYVGDINWNKNIPNLVRACQNLNYPLVIVGSAATRNNVIDHPWNQDLLWLQSQAQKLQKSKQLILTGYISDEDLAIIYNLATIYCQPSFAEGFGLPLIQAMQSGCPVVYSNQTSIPEIMEDNGIPFNPYMKHSLEDSLSKMWNDSKLLESYSKKGFSYSKKFTWKDTAQKTLSVYNLVLNNEK